MANLLFLLHILHLQHMKFYENVVSDVGNMKEQDIEMEYSVLSILNVLEKKKKRELNCYIIYMYSTNIKTR